MLRFNARGPAGLIGGKAPAGNPSKLNGDQRAALAVVGIVERGPIPAIHGVVRWRLIDLMQWVWEEFGISLSEATMSREMKALGYRKISAARATMPRTNSSSRRLKACPRLERGNFPAELAKVRARLPAGTEMASKAAI